MIYELNHEIETLLEKYYNCFDEDRVQIVSNEELETIQKEFSEDTFINNWNTVFDYAYGVY
jgi:hypothetical protein